MINWLEPSWESGAKKAPKGSGLQLAIFNTEKEEHSILNETVFFYTNKDTQHGL